MANNLPILHFAHANGFPANSYQKIFTQLNKRFQILALDKFGHDRNYPISNNWQNSANELIAYLEKHANEPVFAVGHSFGAVISYMAVCQRPELFHGLIMLDPPIISSHERHLMRLVKKTRLIDKITPAGKTEIRRKQWPLHADIAQYYSKAKLFRNFDLDCLNDYVNSVISEHSQQKRLNFKPEVEASVFRGIPDNINKFYGKLTRPTLLVTGEQTDVCKPRYIKNFINKNHLTHHLVQGGHMFPLEHPLDTATLIDKTIAQWQQTD